MIQNILMTTDFSDCSRSAAEMALGMAKKCGANAHLLHATCVIHEVSPFFEQTAYDETEILMEPEARIERGMDSLINNMIINQNTNITSLQKGSSRLNMRYEQAIS